MNLYPEQLAHIVKMCEGLNKIDGTSIPEGLIMETTPTFSGRGIPVFVDGTIIGNLVDEVGGAWSFEVSA